ncbi:hypothetical protein [uncultured Shewanella sp.]|uniref:hypothetical protein n=1 Tax=uncultured Shewanella sp. TaxID=173975 RepID=UPI00260EE87D|nr:hypothetical protein [uncultured Shewanella sp.]
MEEITTILPLVRLISVIVVTIGVSIAVLTFFTNRKDKAKELKEKKSVFYIERCEVALNEVWNNINKPQLDELGNYTIVELLSDYQELKEQVTIEEHKHALNLTESRYRNLIHNVISQANINYVIGIDVPSESNDFDVTYEKLRSVAESSLSDFPIIKGSNYFYGHLMFINGANTEFFESIASFISDKDKDTIVCSYKANHRALKSLRRKYPVFIAAYSFLVSVEQERELQELVKPVSTMFKKKA